MRHIGARCRLLMGLAAVALACGSPEGLDGGGADDASAGDASPGDAGELDASPGRDGGPFDASAGDGGAGRDAGADGSTVDAGSTDAGSTDAGSTDAGSTDAGSTDAGSTDAGSTDAPDAGTVDAGMDGGARDAGSDAGALDAGPPDAGTDAGPPDAGTPDAGTDASPPDAGMDAGPPDGGCISGASGTHVARFRWEGSGPGSTAYVVYEANTLPDRSRWRAGAYSRAGVGYRPVFSDTFLGEGGLEMGSTTFIDIELSTALLGHVSNATIAIYGRSFATSSSGSFTWMTFDGAGTSPYGGVANSAPYQWYSADATTALPAGNDGALLRIEAGGPSNSLVVRRIEICFDAI